jgi:hypothetical protein
MAIRVAVKVYKEVSRDVPNCPLADRAVCALCKGAEMYKRIFRLELQARRVLSYPSVAICLEPVWLGTYASCGPWLLITKVSVGCQRSWVSKADLRVTLKQ